MKKHLILTILTLSTFSVLAEGVNLTCSPYQTVCVNCPEYQTLFPLETFTNDSESLDIEADKSEIISNETYHFSGDVVLKSDSHFLSADDIEVSTADESTLAKGNVKFQDNDFLITSAILTAKKEDDKLTATANNAYFQDYAFGPGGAHGYSGVITKTPSNIFLEDTTYSLCPINKNSWFIKANSINLDLEKNRGIANHAMILFYNFPILYTPKWSWVLEGRGSGFLTPSYSTFDDSTTEKGAYRLRLPYYFNIAPDRDLLLAATYIKYRGFMYEGKYRQLFGRTIDKEGEDVDSIMEIEGQYLSNDRIRGIDRWILDTSIELDITDKIHFSSEYKRSSDKNYFKEVAYKNTNTTSLKSHANLSYYDEGSNLSAHILKEHVQILLDQPSYVRDFESYISKGFEWPEKKQNINVDVISTKFEHKTHGKESGTRTHGNIDFKRIHKFVEPDDIYPELPIITTSANVGYTYYDLNNNKNITRSIGGAGFELAYPLKNQGNLFNTEVSHLLTPKITYKYRGKKVQGDIPIFDTNDNYDNIITFDELIHNERYTGLDRISNANDFTYSIESGIRKINAKTKDEPDLLNIKVAQTYYEDHEVVSDQPNTTFEPRGGYSNIAASISVAIKNFTFNSSLSIDPSSFSIVNKENSISYKANSRKFISLSYSNYATERNIKFYGAFPITKSIHIFAGRDKTTSSNLTNMETSGIVYQSCCWALRIAHMKTPADSDYNYSTIAELVLTGLGSTTSSLDERIAEDIPDYDFKLNE